MIVDNGFEVCRLWDFQREVFGYRLDDRNGGGREKFSQRWEN